MSMEKLINLQGIDTKLKDLNDKDWIGNCHYRKLWLNNIYDKKQKLSVDSLYSNLLKHNNKVFMDCDVIQVQPIFLKNENFRKKSKI